MISISPITYDQKGGIVARAEAGSSLWDRSRRFSRGRNLDGSVTFLDGGHAVGDRDITAQISRATEEVVIRAAEIVEQYSLVTVTMIDGVYHAAPVATRYQDGVLYISLSLKQRA